MAFVNTLIKLAHDDPRIMLLTGDLGFGVFDEFIQRYGQRFINVGVAEAQMTCAAAGLALTGLRPFTYSIASFATARCFEQIKISVAYHGVPVVVVGAGGGYAYGHSGVTHHAGDDLALMRTIPGMTVVAPGDVNEVAALMPQLLNLGGPAYFRIGRGKEPVYQLAEPIILGRARLLSDGEGVAVLSTGEVAYEVFVALARLHEQAIHPLAYQFHTVKPLDKEVLECIAGKTNVIITVDEHARTGGLASAIADWLAERGHGPRLVPLCVEDEFVLGNPHQHEIRGRYGFDCERIVRQVDQFVKT